MLQDVADMSSVLRKSHHKRNQHLESRIDSAAVTCDRSFLESLFHWLLSPAHFPEVTSRTGRRKQTLRAYRLLSGRVKGLMRRFPSENAPLAGVLAIVYERVRKISETRGWVTYVSKDRKQSWYVPKGSLPAIAPRLLLAACIAKALDSGKAPYDLVVEELSSNGLHMEKRTVEMQIRRLLANPEKHAVYGAGRATDPVVLLRQELFDFKTWKEDQRVDRTNMSAEEFDSQFEEYLGQIHPTSEELALLHYLLSNFCKTRKPGCTGIIANLPLSSPDHVDNFKEVGRDHGGLPAPTNANVRTRQSPSR